MADDIRARCEVELPCRDRAKVGRDGRQGGDVDLGRRDRASQHLVGFDDAALNSERSFICRSVEDLKRGRQKLDAAGRAVAEQLHRSDAAVHIDRQRVGGVQLAINSGGGGRELRDLRRQAWLTLPRRRLTDRVDAVVGISRAVLDQHKNGSFIDAAGKDVVVIGGGDTGSDCVGTSNRHGAVSVTQFEVMPQPPEQENKPLVWPYWPLKLRTSSSHDEGCVREFAISTKEFVGEKGKLTGLKTVHVEFKDGKLVEIPGTEKTYQADLVLLAMGFVNPVASILDGFGVDKDGRGNAKATTDFNGGYATNVPKVFAAGDMRRGQSLVVWAIREGRQAAREVDAFLMGSSTLPR